MSYSRLNMIAQREKVFEADSTFEFVMRWMQNIGGKGAIVLHIPANYKESALNVCKTVRKLSGKNFSLSSLVNYQINEILSAQETNKSNLYDLKKSLEHMRFYLETDKKLKRVKVRIPKNIVYDLEFLLSNMVEELGAHDMTVERLLELNLIDLLREMHRGEINAVEAILKGLGVNKEPERKEMLA